MREAIRSSSNKDRLLTTKLNTILWQSQTLPRKKINILRALKSYIAVHFRDYGIDLMQRRNRACRCVQAQQLASAGEIASEIVHRNQF